MHIEVTERRRHRISLTPLIDVVFILLVFFMLASSLTDWREVSLSTGIASAADDSRPPAEVVLLPNNRLRFEDREWTRAELLRSLRERQARDEIDSVILRPDDGVNLQPTVFMLDALAGAGIQAVALGESGD